MIKNSLLVLILSFFLGDISCHRPIFPSFTLPLSMKLSMQRSLGFMQKAYLSVEKNFPLIAALCILLVAARADWMAAQCNKFDKRITALSKAIEDMPLCESEGMIIGNQDGQKQKNDLPLLSFGKNFRENLENGIWIGFFSGKGSFTNSTRIKCCGGKQNNFLCQYALHKNLKGTFALFIQRHYTNSKEDELVLDAMPLDVMEGFIGFLESVVRDAKNSERELAAQETSRQVLQQGVSKQINIQEIEEKKEEKKNEMTNKIEELQKSKDFDCLNKGTAQENIVTFDVFSKGYPLEISLMQGFKDSLIKNILEATENSSNGTIQLTHTITIKFLHGSSFLNLRMIKDNAKFFDFLVDIVFDEIALDISQKDNQKLEVKDICKNAYVIDDKKSEKKIVIHELPIDFMVVEDLLKFLKNTEEPKAKFLQQKKDNPLKKNQIIKSESLLKM